jgi:Mannosyltransferase (PIG-V)
VHLSVPISRRAWKEATWVFVLSRCVILLGTYISITTIPLHGWKTAHNCTAEFKLCLLSWFDWDGAIYVYIAQHGYHVLRYTVFFPLWPLLIHTVSAFFGTYFITYYVVGVFLANLCFYLALVIFYALLSEDFEPTLARNALYYLAFYPYGLFFFAGYAESLFLLLSLAVFFFLQRGKALDWWLAGICGFFAALTRAPGIMLVVPFLVVFVQRFWLDSEGKQSSWLKKGKALLPVILIPAGVLVYMLYLNYTMGNPFAFSTQEATSWNRHLTFPWHGIIATIRLLLFTSSPLQALNFLDLTFTLLPLTALLIGWRHLPLQYSLYALAMVIFALSYPFISAEPLSATPRYLMVIFPIFVILARWGKYPLFDRVVLACSLPLFALNIVFFISHYWVA